MRLGVIARAEQRGLGIQTHEVCRHLDPDRVLLIEPAPSMWPQHSERYAGFDVTVARWANLQLNPNVVRRWLDGLDVVYTAETLYDWRVAEWAAAAGCVVVCQANPEMLPPEAWQVAGVRWWAATPWRLEHLPAGARVVPMPVALDRFPPPRQGSGPVRFLHSVGHRAMEDRAGVEVVAQAVRRLRAPCEIVARTQDRRLVTHIQSKSPHVTVAVHEQGVSEYWQQYDGCDVLILPRRFGGLSLPSQEAMAAGLGLVMTDCSPNEVWPGPRIPVRGRRQVAMLGGLIDVCDPSVDGLVEIMERLAGDRSEVELLRAEALEWAKRNSWDALAPVWLAELEAACLSSSRGRVGARTGNRPGNG